MSRGRSGTAWGRGGEPLGAPVAILRGKGRWSARRRMTLMLELLCEAELDATRRVTLQELAEML